MTFRRNWLPFILASAALGVALAGQPPEACSQSLPTVGLETPGSPAKAVVPRLIKFSGTLLDEQAQPMKSPVGVTFALYAQQSGSAALWMETQNVETDAKGNYTVLLGANSANGVPAELFTTGEARWLGVQAERQPEQPRVLLVSVPYALKAGDAQTLGGLPASAFAPASSAAATISSSSTSSTVPPVLLASPSATSAATTPLITTVPVTTAGGTTNFIPLWGGGTPSTTLGNSLLFQSSASNVTVNGSFSLPAVNTATTTVGSNSQPLDFLASSFNSSPAPGAAVAQHFRWQAEPVGNNTTTPSGKLNLLFGSGTATPAGTGFSISSKGIITFASGQTMPTVTGNETVSGNLTATGSVSGASAKFTGAISTGNETVNGNISASGSLTAGSASLGGTTVKGNGLNLALGDPGCSTGFAGLGPSPMTGCTNYALISDNVGHTYVNSTSTGGAIHLRHNNGEQMTITPTGLVGIGTSTPGTMLDVTAPNAINDPVAQFGNLGSSSNSILVHNKFCAFSACLPSALTTGTTTMFLSGGFNTFMPGTVPGDGGLRVTLGRSIFFGDSSNSRMVIRNNGNVGIGTTAPSFALHVNGMVRTETGLSLGGNAPIAVDAPGIIGGRFAVLTNGNVGINNPNPVAALDVAGSVRINGDTPMSSNPHMSFSGAFPYGFCADITCGNVASNFLQIGGFFVPDKAIQITRMTVAVGQATDPSCAGVPAISIFLNETFTAPAFRLSIPGGAIGVQLGSVVDSGTIAVNVSAGQPVILFLDGASKCNAGTSGGGFGFANVQYVMQ